MANETSETLKWERLDASLRPVFDRTPFKRSLNTYAPQLDYTNFVAGRCESISFEDEAAQCTVTYHACPVAIVGENIEWDRSNAVVTWQYFTDKRNSYLRGK